MPQPAAFPPALAYLQPAADAISQQDEDAVLSGDADLEPVLGALRGKFDRLRGREGEAAFDVDRAALRAWVARQPDQNAPALQAAHVLVGVMLAMRFRDMFRPAPKPDPTFSPANTRLVAPPGWTVKPEPACIVISARGVEGMAQPLNAELFASLCKPLPAPMGQPSGVVMEREERYTNAGNPRVRGMRLLVRHKPPLPERLLTATYVVEVPGGYLKVSSGVTGRADLSEHMPALESIIAGATIAASPTA